MTAPLQHSITPTLPEFRELAGRGNVIPLTVELIADAETPISAFSKIDDGRPCFLFESAENNEQSGRFSFVGFDPIAIIDSREIDGDPLDALQRVMSQYEFVRPGNDSPLLPGAVGYVGYDVVRFFEKAVPIHARDDLRLPEAFFMVPRTVLSFDHRYRKLRITTLARIDQKGSVDAAYQTARGALEQALRLLGRVIELRPIDAGRISELPTAQSNTAAAEFQAMVRQAKELISAGDIFQVVLSQRFEMPFAGAPIDLYRALRFGNPSPYMFCLRLPDNLTVLGSSPEVHVRVREGLAEIRPIAGTARRGADPEEDEQLASKLIADPKERAEHVMLIDLGRNDLGRIAEYGSVKVTEQMVIERYSHVMHIVSHVIARLRGERNAFDVLRATFPAGTVSGAPKIRAMQIIAELEKARRGFYAGVVGYFGFDGSHDSCIAIRSVVLKDGKAYFQTGAGIVADSDPAHEHEECVNKAKAMIEAIVRAKTN